jgi:hypothetical protein
MMWRGGRRKTIASSVTFHLSAKTLVTFQIGVNVSPLQLLKSFSAAPPFAGYDVRTLKQVEVSGGFSPLGSSKNIAIVCHSHLT